MVAILARRVGVCRFSDGKLLLALIALAASSFTAEATPPGTNTPVIVATAIDQADPDSALESDAAGQSAIAAPAIQPDARSPHGRTRFVIGLDKATNFQVFALPHPNRVIVDLPDVRVNLPTISGDEPVGLVKSFRGGLASAGKMRVVIDVTEPVIIEKSALETVKGATRLVLDIVPADSKPASKKPLDVSLRSGAGLGSLQPPVPKLAERPEARAAKTYKPIIVLDPGHGGQDSGAARSGTVEKDVVLAFALTLRDKLNATGRYKVMMTRDTDVFIPLSDRREFAERNRAALFIAIHADYARSQARGATIYSLREGVAKELKRSASGEVMNSVLSDSEMKTLRQGTDGDFGTVKGILADLAQREVQVTQERTSVFARSVIEYMGTSTNMMANPDRSASFAVLRTAKVPAVLMELAYVSNKEDAAQLNSNEWRFKVSGSIVTAVDNYFSHQLVRLPM
jgi:N-acetylmuramoyl-L-alanine amidase